VRLVEKLHPRRHSFSHFELEMRPVRLAPVGQLALVAEGDNPAWYRYTTLMDLGLPAPILRLLRDMGEEDLEGIGPSSELSI
jgi:A/G-specific adenine glycosylase